MADLKNDLEKDKYYSDENDIEINEDNARLDSLSIYFKEVDEYPVLSRDEEIRVAKRAFVGDNDARELLVKSNLRLVIKFARKYCNSELELADLIQYGNMGLLTAVDKYDVNRQIRFSTYASYWIIQSILRGACNQNRSIKLPFHLHEKMVKYKKTVSYLGRKLGKFPDFSQIADYMGISVDDVKLLCSFYNNERSLDYINDNDDLENKDLFGLIADDSKNVELDVVRYDMTVRVRELVNNLKNKKYIEVLKMRYGIDRECPMTQKEVAEVLNVSVVRVQQLENYAISLLRESRRIKDFSVYMDDPLVALDRLEECRRAYAMDNQKRYHKVLKMIDSKDRR